MLSSLSDYLTRSAKRYSRKIAFKSGKDAITYQQLDADATSLAETLIDAGIKKGERVGIYMNRCLETATAIYGILRAGAVYVPIDIKLPKERVNFLIQDCDIKVIISKSIHEKTLKIVDETKKLNAIIGIELEGVRRSITWEHAIEKPIAHHSPVNIIQDDLAYILYTSGSTGIPKGIMHTHRSAMAYAELTADTYQITNEDIIGNHAPIFFDISTLGYFTAVFVGATTVIATDGEIVFTSNLIDLFEKERLTIWYSVPLVVIQMLKHPAIKSKKYTQLRWLLYAGEAFDPSLLRKWMLQFSQVKVSNIYGPTETNQCTNYNLLEPPSGTDPIPIGKVWKNTAYRIIDEGGKNCHPGEVGELLIRSATVMYGYWNRPDLTEKAFYLEKTSLNYERKFYRTGDLVYEDNKGILHFKGRKDHQIKFRGYRIELTEIELALNNHQEIAESVCFLDNNGAEAKILAFINVGNPNTLDVNSIKNHLKSLIPGYAIPQHFIIKSDFPRTSTGKINRKELINNK